MTNNVMIYEQGKTIYKESYNSPLNLTTDKEMSANTEMQRAILEFIQVSFTFDEHFFVVLGFLHKYVALHGPRPV